MAHVRLRLRRKTTPASAEANVKPPDRSCILRGICKSQAPSKYSGQVQGLQGQERRNALKKLYEENRPKRTGRPARKKKPVDAAGESRAPRKKVKQEPAEQRAPRKKVKEEPGEQMAPRKKLKQEQCDDLGLESPGDAMSISPALPVPVANSFQPDASESPRLLAAGSTTSGGFGDLSHLQAECLRLKSKLAKCTARLRWHEEVRDWIGAVGESAAASMLKWNLAPSYLKFQGCLLRDDNGDDDYDVS
eukprot:s2984_g10.t1